MTALLRTIPADEVAMAVAYEILAEHPEMRRADAQAVAVPAVRAMRRFAPALYTDTSTPRQRARDLWGNATEPRCGTGGAMGCERPAGHTSVRTLEPQYAHIVVHARLDPLYEEYGVVLWLGDNGTSEERWGVQHGGWRP